MDSQTIEYEGHGLTARIVVTAATVLQGAKRTRLRFEGDGEKDPDRRLVRLFVYPDLIASARSIEISGIEALDFDQFLQLPEDLVRQWEDATFTLNPHWLPPSETDEKKEG